VDSVLGHYRTAAGYRTYPALSPVDKGRLQSRLSALAESLTGLPAIFAR
jgi:iron uptake system EfeUOB component EfeO/EfeM